MFTFAAAFAGGFFQLLGIRFLQGLGYGGEAAVGGVLISEAVRPALRARMSGSLQGKRAAAWHWLSRQQPKLTHALRMAASALATFALAAALGLPQGFWAVITALIVSQSSVGGSLKAAWERFLGSVFGAVYGGAVAFAIPHGGGSGRTAALVVALAPFSILAASSAGFRGAPITAIIVLLGTAGAALGHMVAILETAAQVARLLADQLEMLVFPSAKRAEADSGVLVTKTRQTLNRLEMLVSEAARERRSHLAADAPDPEPLLRTLLRLRHDLVMLRRAVWKPGGGERVREQLARPWAFAVEAGAAVLRDVGQALFGRRTPVGSGALAEAVIAYTATIDEVRRRGLTRVLPSDTVDRISGTGFATGFALDQFRRDLDVLIERARECSAQAGEGAEG